MKALVPNIFILALLSASLSAARASGAPDRERRFVEIRHDIVEDRVLVKGATYVIVDEVHVRAGVTLTIDDGVTILIRNGRIRGDLLDRRALIFDTGSRLRAENLTVKACDNDNHVAHIADNGGLWFLGSWQKAEKDGVAVKFPGTGRQSFFSAQSIHVSYLGRRDIARDRGDDVDGLSVLGMGMAEWKVWAVRSDFSGDDGFDVTNSRLRLRDLSVRSPTEDALNISSSRVEISDRLVVSMTRSDAPDREIFDLEVDDGPSYVVLNEGTRVDVTGYFGDEVKLRSRNMPAFDPCHCVLYDFHGLIRNGPSTIYSITED